MSNLKTPLLFFLASAGATAVFIYFHLQEIAPESWPTTSAKIDTVYTDYHDERQFAIAEYSFTINDEKYEGNGIPLDEFGNLIYLRSTDSRIHEKVRYIRSQKNIDIYYNPENPSESTPNLDVNYGFLAGSAVAGLFAALGLIGVITAMRGGRPTGNLNEDDAAKAINAVKDKYTK